MRVLDGESRTVLGVPPGEYADRVAGARELTAERGWDGLVVLGRGGGPFERFGDLLYLTGHYTTFPTIADRPPHWRMRGHAAAVVTAERVVLLTDDPVDTPLVAADAVRETHDLPAAIAEELAEAGLTGRRVGVVGAEAMAESHRAVLRAAAGELIAADGLLAPLRTIKSPAEQDLLRAAGRAGGAAVSAAMEAALAGASEQEAAAAAMASAVGSGAAVANAFTQISGPGRPARRRPFPAYAGDVPARPGDVFLIDMSGALDGYFFDFSRTCVVGADRHGGHDALAIATEIVKSVVAGLRPGRTVAEVVAEGRAAIDRHPEWAPDGGFDALGHGLGLGFEEPWLVPEDETELVPGMCIAVERYVSRAGVAAAFEHNVLVTHGEPEVLDAAPERWAT